MNTVPGQEAGLQWCRTQQIETIQDKVHGQEMHDQEHQTLSAETPLDHRLLARSCNKFYRPFDPLLVTNRATP